MIVEYILFSIFYWITAFFLINKLSSNFDKKVFAGASVIHYLTTLFYILLSQVNPADATTYFRDALEAVSWNVYWTAGYNFIVAFLFPFVKWFGFGYVLSYLPFSILGLAGYFLLLRYVRSLFTNTNSKWLFVLWLPQLHFFTCAIGKDSLIFFGICLIAVSIYSRIKWGYFILGVLIVGLIRLHILSFILIAIGVYFILISKTNTSLKVLSITVAIVGISFLLPFFNEFVGLKETETYLDYIDRRQTYNTDAGSSIDISNQNVLIKLFSYLGRPLFFDAKSTFMFEASIENLIWIYMFFVIAYSYIKQIKSSKRILIYILPFLSILIPNSLLLTNLGIAMRQKTMMFPFLFLAFTYYKYNPLEIKYKQILEIIKKYVKDKHNHSGV